MKGNLEYNHSFVSLDNDYTDMCRGSARPCGVSLIFSSPIACSFSSLIALWPVSFPYLFFFFPPISQPTFTCPPSVFHVSLLPAENCTVRSQVHGQEPERCCREGALLSFYLAAHTVFFFLPAAPISSPFPTSFYTSKPATNKSTFCLSQCSAIFII